ncbi:MAG: DUF1566 domain-containing protein [Nitrospirae bacterium]|nr:DUF1566 domain-containing protein [Nitrospirota bacterium]MBF0590888.1 DUF1566 domain-containing protein [Nitrospirota bacterium]
MIIQLRYVADPANNRIQKFSSSGAFITKWGSSGSGDGQFNSPYGVAVDTSGNVYVADNGNNRIQKFAPATTVNLPQTGQTTSYAAGDDGALRAGVAWPNPRFTDNGDQTLTDNLTGLMWIKNANLPGTTKTWQQALDYVASMNTGAIGTCGYTDWRLPNIIEMESLVNVGQADQTTWLGSQGFTNVQSSYYWSSTTYTNSTPSNVWVIHMYDGQVNLYAKSGNSYVWPVSSGQSGTSAIWQTGQTTTYATGDDGALQKGVAWPNPRFTDNGNQTVTDNLTGLIWTKDANLPGTYKAWQQALDYVASMNTGAGMYGYTNWRLPNREELFSLIDRGRVSPSLPSGHPFSNIQSSCWWYWSSSTYANDTSNAWVTLMDDGKVYADGKSKNTYYCVWPVRGGQSDNTTGVFWTGNSSLMSYHSALLSNPNQDGLATDVIGLQPGTPAGFFQWEFDKTLCPHVQISDANNTGTPATVNIVVQDWANNMADRGMPNDPDVYRGVTLSPSSPIVIAPYDATDGAWSTVMIQFNNVATARQLGISCTTAAPNIGNPVAANGTEGILYDGTYKWTGNGSIISTYFSSLYSYRNTDSPSIRPVLGSSALTTEEDWPYGVFRDVAAASKSSYKPVVFFQWQVTPGGKSGSNGGCEMLTLYATSASEIGGGTTNNTVTADIKVKPWNAPDSMATVYNNQVISGFQIQPDMSTGLGLWWVIEVKFNAPVTSPVYVHAVCNGVTL